MNKLNVFALLLLVVAGSQLLARAEDDVVEEAKTKKDVVEEAKASDKEEVAALDEKSDALREFCLEIRDYVTSDIQNKAESLKTAVAGVIQSSKDQLRKYVKEVHERASKEAKQMTSENNLRNVDDIVTKGQRSLGQRLVSAPLRPSALFRSAKRAWEKANEFIVEQQQALGKRLQESPVEPSAVFNSAKSALMEASGAVKKGFNSARDATTKVLSDTCELMADYEREIQRRFEALKMGTSDQSLAKLSLNEVECVAVSSVLSMRQACLQEKME